MTEWDCMLAPGTKVLFSFDEHAVRETGSRKMHILIRTIGFFK